MPEVAYKSKKFNDEHLGIILQAREICAEYAAQGYDLTLRQLYYQFVARDLIENTQREYKRLGGIINDARLAGVLDWDYIVDRTRNVREPAKWESPAQIIAAAEQSYFVDRWEGQKYRVEVWVEKDALGGVIEQACDDDRIPWFSCRGYTSQSEIWGAAQRLRGYLLKGQMPVILHLGDHDPSGIDMTRDIRDRLNLFMLRDWVNGQGWGEDEDEDDEIDSWYVSDIQTHMGEAVRHIYGVEYGGESDIDSDELPVIVDRIALNMMQVRQYDPPPNYAKITDSRAKDYIERFGDDSWELDALEPRVLTTLIRDTVWEYIDRDIWDSNIEREERGRETLKGVRERLNTDTEGEEE